jgi:hypothetical protein
MPNSARAAGACGGLLFFHRARGAYVKASLLHLRKDLLDSGAGAFLVLLSGEVVLVSSCVRAEACGAPEPTQLLDPDDESVSPATIALATLVSFHSPK